MYYKRGIVRILFTSLPFGSLFLPDSLNNDELQDVEQGWFHHLERQNKRSLVFARALSQQQHQTTTVIIVGGSCRTLRERGDSIGRKSPQEAALGVNREAKEFRIRGGSCRRFFPAHSPLASH
ncbi:hypothetical protein CDAR_527621 [Caerostris darwini]|uniref:Secreted protein n=1 Tax=Caerostris darwini TaxID=1538125 RepID=A0AAV4R883_9ARAC|nr:hypothetical protein CDAR_527621 [Caerostris darwini]